MVVVGRHGFAAGRAAWPPTAPVAAFKGTSDQDLWHSALGHVAYQGSDDSAESASRMVPLSADVATEVARCSRAGEDHVDPPDQPTGHPDHRHPTIPRPLTGNLGGSPLSFSHRTAACSLGEALRRGQDGLGKGSKC